ncbi:MAG TPA: urate oxidase [Gaiellaceae bacterium]|nr:urate oxidase [Gaiellaceae bacterium]
MARPVATAYGKHAVSVYRVGGGRLFACEVDMLVRGEAFTSAYTEGDNSLVVATDSMKNFIHRTAADAAPVGLEDLLVEVGTRFLARYEHVDSVEVSGRERVFAPRAGNVLQRLYDDRASATLTLFRDGRRIEHSGREGLHLIKLSGSAFAGFVRDEYTTLPETRDRPLFVHLDVRWQNGDYARRADGERVRETLVATFAEFDSESIQHLVHEMGVRALERFPEIAALRFRAENRLWDTAHAAGDVTVYTDARPPYGVIELEIER